MIFFSKYYFYSHILSAVICFFCSHNWLVTVISFLIAILHRDLRNDIFFLQTIYFFQFLFGLFSPFLLGLLFPFLFKTFISFLDFYSFFRLLFLFQTFISFFGLLFHFLRKSRSVFFSDQNSTNFQRHILFLLMF